MSALILLVDDVPSVRQLIPMSLRKHGYRVEAAADAEEALKMLNKQQFDLLMVDLNMPKVNGFTLIEKIKQMENYQNTPILMLTAMNSKQLVKQGESLGITGWCVKPISMNKLAETVKMALKHPK